MPAGGTDFLERQAMADASSPACRAGVGGGLGSCLFSEQWGPLRVGVCAVELEPLPGPRGRVLRGPGEPMQQASEPVKVNR